MAHSNKKTFKILVKIANKDWSGPALLWRDGYLSVSDYEMEWPILDHWRAWAAVMCTCVSKVSKVWTYQAFLQHVEHHSWSDVIANHDPAEWDTHQVAPRPIRYCSSGAVTTQQLIVWRAQMFRPVRTTTWQNIKCYWCFESLEKVWL